MNKGCFLGSAELLVLPKLNLLSSLEKIQALLFD